MIADYNLEFAHIYADEQFGPEQAKGMACANEVMTRLSAAGKTFVTSVLIDEFNPATNILDENDFVVKFKVNNTPVDFIGYESRFTVVADTIIRELPTSMLTLKHFNHPDRSVLMLQDGPLKIGLEEKKPNLKHTCAILSAAWTLCRLGVYPMPEGGLKILNPRQKFVARKTITILPEKYRSGEERVLEIIKNLPYADRLPDIEYEFFSWPWIGILNHMYMQLAMRYGLLWYGLFVS